MQSTGYCLLRILSARRCCMRQHSKMASGKHRVNLCCLARVRWLSLADWWWWWQCDKSFGVRAGEGDSPWEQQVSGWHRRLIPIGLRLVQAFITGGSGWNNRFITNGFWLITRFITNHGFWLIKHFITNHGFWLIKRLITNHGFWLIKRFITNYVFWLKQTFYSQWFMVETIVS